MISDYQQRPEGIRVKHQLKQNSIKVYDKQGSVLRVETTINDPSDFRVFRPKQDAPEGPCQWQPMRKGIADLRRRTEVSQACNERYLDALASLSTDQPLADLLTPVCRPTQWKGRRVAKHENTWRTIAREAAGNDLAVEVSQGTLEELRPTRIGAAEGDRAAFRLVGGLGYVPVTVTGLRHYRRPVLELEQADGTRRAVDQSVHGNDYWQADYIAASGTWEITYTLPADIPDDARQKRGFRFRMEK